MSLEQFNAVVIISVSREIAYDHLKRKRNKISSFCFIWFGLFVLSNCNLVLIISLDIRFEKNEDYLMLS